MPGFHVKFRQIRQDATNTNMWSGKKISVTELKLASTTWPTCWNTSWEEVSSHLESRCTLTELRPIGKGNASGSGLLGVGKGSGKKGGKKATY